MPDSRGCRGGMEERGMTPVFMTGPEPTAGAQDLLVLAVGMGVASSNLEAGAAPSGQSRFHLVLGPEEPLRGSAG